VSLKLITTGFCSPKCSKHPNTELFTEQENAMKSSWIRIGLPSLLVLFLASSLAQAQTYLMTRLGFSPTSPTINGANGINNNGDVVGYDSAINGAYLLHNGVVSSLGMTSASGVAISSTGHVALRSWGPDLHSYLFTPGRRIWFISPFTDLGTLGGTGGLNNTGQTVALGMNDSRTIVGSSTIPTTPQTWHAFSWSAGHMTDLGALSPGGTSSANAINNPGQIVGDSFGTNGIDRAFTMVNGAMTDMDPANPNYDSSAVAINDGGQIVVNTDLAWRLIRVGRGWRFVAYAGPTYYPQVYNNGVFTSIGTLGYTGDVWAYSINSAGDVVGTAIDSTINRTHAFLYHAGTMKELNDVVTNLSGWRVSIATRINDSGEIVCWVHSNTTDEIQTAILTPILD
jgi:probable HAF family extracellular repeat protein